MLDNRAKKKKTQSFLMLQIVCIGCRPVDVQLLFDGRRAVLQEPLRAAFQGDRKFLQEIHAR
jgi:hypothetical protein